MRIGFDITVLYVAQAGVFYYHYNLIRAMLQLNLSHQFMFLDYYPIHGGWLNPPETAMLTASNAEVRHVRGLRHRRLSRLWFLQRPGLYPVARSVDRILLYPWGKLVDTVMTRQLQKHLDGLDIFHVSDVLQYAVPGAKNVITIHDMTTLLFPEYHTAETRRLQQQKFRFAQEKADVIIAVSESTKRDVVSLLGIEPERVQVVYEGVTPAFRPLPVEDVAQTVKAMGLQAKEYILHVGTLEPRKNLVRLVEAYHQVRQEVSPPVPKLVLAGATGWLFRQIFDRIKALDLSGDVIFLGRIDDTLLPALYNGALLLVYPSLYEGFGLPVLEAMACGIPVITSNISSLPEVIGDAGLVVAPADKQALAEAIGKLICDQGLREALSIAGLQRARLFSWERAAYQTLSVYENAIRSIN